jgi:hypothetical protein
MNKFFFPVLLSLLYASSAHAVYKCVDDKGVTHYGDTLPPQCATKSVTEINRAGFAKKIEAPPTPEEIKKKEAEKAARAEVEKKVAEQRLKDRALLGTYGTEKELDAIRDREISQLDGRKKTLGARAIELDAILNKLSGEMEFYRAGKSKASKSREAPIQLVHDLDRAKRDRTGLDAELIKVDEDKAAVVERYSVEKERWKKLKAGMPAGTLPQEEKPAVAPHEADKGDHGKAPATKAEPDKKAAPPAKK